MFFFSSRRRHTRFSRDWSSDVCSSDLAQDVGFAMNPTYIEGQIEGGVAQGLGQALSEEIVYENGRVLNPNRSEERRVGKECRSRWLRERAGRKQDPE